MLKFVKRQGLVNYVSLYVSNISKCFFFQISFIRRRDFHILTNGHNVYTTDKRVEILHAAKSHDWYLVISKANHNDSGIYECQVIFQSLKLLNNLVQLLRSTQTSRMKIKVVQYYKWDKKMWGFVFQKLLPILWRFSETFHQA